MSSRGPPFLPRRALGGEGMLLLGVKTREPFLAGRTRLVTQHPFDAFLDTALQPAPHTWLRLPRSHGRTLTDLRQHGNPQSVTQRGTLE